MKNVYFIEGARTPFLRSGTEYKDLMSWELGMYAIKGLMQRVPVHGSDIDKVVMGTTISNIQTGNVARESAVMAGIAESTPCHTVTQACISANQAICSGAESIMLGKASIVIAGGVDNVSDTPIGFPKKMRKKLFEAQKLKGLGDSIQFALSLRISDFIPERPAIAEYLTGRTMGQDCEILTSRFSISRESQDEWAYRSHQLAHKAWEQGFLSDIIPVQLPPAFQSISKDNGVRGDTSLERLASLKPAFDKAQGTLTAGNSSFLTDGASAVLLADEEAVKKYNLSPKAKIVAYAFTGQSLKEELLLGPAYAIHKVLQETNMNIQNLDVIELHEAFAGQVLSNIKALASDSFNIKQLKRANSIGELPIQKVNTWGGSLAIGHPFGATGGRLLSMAANRLIAEKGRYALLAACAAGAHGHAMIIERC